VLHAWKSGAVQEIGKSTALNAAPERASSEARNLTGSPLNCNPTPKGHRACQFGRRTKWRFSTDTAHQILPIPVG